MIMLEVLATVLVAGGGWLMFATKVIKQYERGLVFRFGRVRPEIRGPGLAMIVPGVDRLQRVSMQIITMPVPAQEGITRDNVTVRVDAVVYFKVADPVRAVIAVEDYRYAVAQVAQTSLRSIIGKSELDDLLSNRERLNEGLEVMIDSPALEWGVHIDRVEIKDVALPDSMKRSMSRQAEAERERRARVITARVAGLAQAGRGGEHDGRDAHRAPAPAVADHRGGGRGEELHPRTPVSRRTAPLPGARPGDPRPARHPGYAGRWTWASQQPRSGWQRLA
jgi:regulator of protease activity HflC (stomatin/prohibitin superfamily)